MSKGNFSTPKNFVNRTLQRFGRLTAIEAAGRSPRGNIIWRCLCDCGKFVLVRGSELGKGTRSCGCLQKELTSLRQRTHGHGHPTRRTKEYRAWMGMRERCQLPRNPRFSHYGGRGISVCERWQKFENFLADMPPHPGEGFSLDRIDNDGDYEPGNCRWATRSEQRKNRRPFKRKRAKEHTQC